MTDQSIYRVIHFGCRNVFHNFIKNLSCFSNLILRGRNNVNNFKSKKFYDLGAVKPCTFNQIKAPSSELWPSSGASAHFFSGTSTNSRQTLIDHWVRWGQNSGTYIVLIVIDAHDDSNSHYVALLVKQKTIVFFVIWYCGPSFSYCVWLLVTTALICTNQQSTADLPIWEWSKINNTISELILIKLLLKLIWNDNFIISFFCNIFRSRVDIFSFLYWK